MKTIVRAAAPVAVVLCLFTAGCGGAPPTPDHSSASSAPAAAPPAAPPRARRMLAVLPIDLTHAKQKIDADGEASLEEMLRDVATDALASRGWIIMNNMTMLQLLEDNGVDPKQCGNEECHLASARKLKAEKFISGAVQFVEGEFTASIRLIDSQSGQSVASERVSAKTALTLRTAFEAKAGDFFRRAGMLGRDGQSEPDTAGAVVVQDAPPPEVENGRPESKKKAIRKEVGRLVVSAKPKGQVRLEVVDPDGKRTAAGSTYENAEAAPGHWVVTAKSKGYEEETEAADVETDAVKAVNFDLKPFGGLSVSGEPAGAAVAVTGPGGFKDEGGLGSEWNGLKRGTYQVKVTRKGYVDGVKSVTVEPGRTASVNIVLERVPVATAVVASTGSSDDTFRAAGLEWQKQPNRQGLTWEDAKQYCSSLSVAGGGWRLPTKDELLALYNANTKVHESLLYWSSSPSGSPGHAWGVDFLLGYVDNNDTGGTGAVRCVQ